VLVEPLKHLVEPLSLPCSPLHKKTRVISPLEGEAPFPDALKKPKKKELDSEALDVLRKCEVSIPLLDAIKQVPRYSKCLKELCASNREQRLKSGDKHNLHVNAVFRTKIPPM